MLVHGDIKLVGSLEKYLLLN